MSEVEVEVKKWGNSLGVLLPKEVVREEGLKRGDRVILKVSIVRYPDPKSFGALRGWKVDAQKLKDRIRAEDDW